MTNRAKTMATAIALAAGVDEGAGSPLKAPRTRWTAARNRGFAAKLKKSTGWMRVLSIMAVVIPQPSPASARND